MGSIPKLSFLGLVPHFDVGCIVLKMLWVDVYIQILLLKKESNQQNRGSNYLHYLLFSLKIQFLFNMFSLHVFMKDK